MRIVFIARLLLSDLSKWNKFDRELPDVKWGFPLGGEIVKGLVARDHEVSVVFDFGHEENIRVFKGERHENGGRCDIYLVPESSSTRRQFLTLFSRETKGIRRAIGMINPDVVFANWTYCYAYAGLTSGYPTLVVAHDSPWRVFRTFRNFQALIKAVYATLFVVPRIKYVTAVSPYIVREFKKFRCLRNVDIPVIPNGIEIGGEDNHVERVDSVEGVGNKTIICISQKGRLKNSVALFKAWEILKPKHPDWRLLVYGEGMPQGVASKGELDRVLRGEADLLVSPSLEESFGMVFVEAMRFGVPCIGGEKSGAVPWVIGEGGVVCDVTKPEKLAECIESVMGDVELRKRLSEGGKRRVKEMFDIDKIVDLYEAKLWEIIHV